MEFSKMATILFLGAPQRLYKIVRSVSRLNLR